MKKGVFYGCSLGFGGFLYSLVEILFRGYTHPSMFLLGGLCFVVIGMLRRQFASAPLAEKMLLSGLAVTALELVCGLFVNRVLAWNVWDYSCEPLNLYGQICLPYTAFWCLLSLPAMGLDRFFCRCARKAAGAEGGNAADAAGKGLRLPH